MPVTTPRLDWAAVRDRFPILHEEVGGKPLVYLDNAATSQKPQSVIDALNEYYEHTNANVHRGIHELSRRSTVAYEEARARVARFIGAAEAEELVWTRGTTEAINLVAGSWGLENLREGDEILLSTMEHHSNIVPWQLVARRTGASLKYIEMDDEGRLILDDLPELLTERTRLVAISHVSNALGTVNPSVTSPSRPKPLAHSCWWTEHRPFPTAGSTFRRWAATSTPSRATRCAGPPASADSGLVRSSWSPCRRITAGAR